MKEFPHDVVTAPYGTWASPLSAAEVHAGSAPIFDAAVRGEHIYYSTKVPSENSRTGLIRTSLSHPGDRVQVLPESFNIRSSVHEYGGSAWALDPDSDVIYFVNASDQRIWQLIPGRSPHPLTPETSSRIRYGDLVMTPWGLLCIREDNRSVRKERTVVLLTRHGRVRVLASPAHFLAWPRISPDGSTLAVIGWEHPNMPWDSTSLWLIDLTEVDPVVIGVLHGWDDSGSAGAGSAAVALLQPEFTSDTSLLVSSDHTGTWALHSFDFADALERARTERADAARPGAPYGSALRSALHRAGTGRPAHEFALTDLTPVLETEGEIGGALWQLGSRWYLVDGGEVWAHAQSATARVLQATLAQDRGAGESVEIAAPMGRVLPAGRARPTGLEIEAAGAELFDLTPTHVLLTLRANDRAGALCALDRRTGQITEIASERLDAQFEYFSHPDVTTMGGVPVVIHPPHNPHFAALERELPPFIVLIHGGPTGQAVPSMSARASYFTSRGFGVMEVNYGGSTGFGGAWRNRLRGQWGIVDVDDAVSAVQGLVDAGLADPRRIAISGASAGGWTVLCALASSDVFACGVSYFGVTDLVKFVVDTHDFESHYIDGLVGPLPEAMDEYLARSPIRRVQDIHAPVAIMQGDRDPIVPPSQAQEFVSMLDRVGTEHIYRLYRGESHGFVRAETIIDSLESELGFYADVFGIPRNRRHV